MIKWHSLPILLFFLLITNLSAALTDIRIAYIDPFDNRGIDSTISFTDTVALIPEAFLQRAKKNNYTHIIVSYRMWENYSAILDWFNGKYVGGSSMNRRGTVLVK